MRFIPTRVHGAIDYLMALIVVTLPWWSGSNRGGAETWLPVALGVAILGNVLMTDFELGVARLISVPTHLALDLGVGVLLLLSPWLFRFADMGVKSYVVVGIMELAVALCTRTAREPRVVRAASAPIGGGTRR